MSRFDHIITRKGRRIVVFPKHSTLNGREYGRSLEEYENYVLTIYEDFMTIRQGSDESLGASLVTYSLDDVISFCEYQVEGFHPIQLKFPETDGFGNVLQE